MKHALYSWQQEKRAAYLYRIIAACERIAVRQTLFDRLAREADIQAELWAREATICVRRSGR